MRRFRQEHLVVPTIDGTLYTDRVEYELYGGRLVEILFLNRYMSYIFVPNQTYMLSY
jgi:ligand-binding SRPBCC domain-containing protein